MSLFVTFNLEISKCAKSMQLTNVTLNKSGLEGAGYDLIYTLTGNDAPLAVIQ